MKKKDGSTYEHCIILMCKVKIAALARIIILLVIIRRRVQYKNNKVFFWKRKILITKISLLHAFSSFCTQSRLQRLLAPLSKHQPVPLLVYLSSVSMRATVAGFF